VEKTNYFTVEAYGAQACSCAHYLGRGSRVVVEAELDWREWTDQQQHKREAVTFRARQVLFEDRRHEDRDGNGAERPSADPAPPVASVTAASSAASVLDVADGGAAGPDDLPF
jgi:single-stranded DNA-binding protein